MSTYTWIDNCNDIDWYELFNLYKIAPLGDKPAESALADGYDCSYICDVAIHPDFQSCGLGKAMIKKLVEDSKEHQKIILYAVSTKEPFYAKFGFARMKTAMAIFKNQEKAINVGVIER